MSKDKETKTWREIWILFKRIFNILNKNINETDLTLQPNYILFNYKLKIAQNYEK